MLRTSCRQSNYKESNLTSAKLEISREMVFAARKKDAGFREMMAAKSLDMILAEFDNQVVREIWSEGDAYHAIPYLWFIHGEAMPTIYPSEWKTKPRTPIASDLTQRIVLFARPSLQVHGSKPSGSFNPLVLTKPHSLPNLQ